MNSVFLDAQVSDTVRRERLYSGQLFLYAPTPSSLALCEFARSMIQEAFGTRDPEKAQFDMPVEEAEAAKRVGNLPENFGPDVLQPFNEKIVLEIQRALQFFFTSTQFNKVDHILLTGGSAMLDGLEEMVNQRTQVHTVVANPFANMALSSKIKPRQLTIDAPSLMVACGLAMRRFDPS